MPGHWINVTWSGGNAVSADLVVLNQLAGIGPGFGTYDTLETVASYDNKNNFRKMVFPIGGGEGLFDYLSANNSPLVIASNTVFPFINAGDTIKYSVFTYNVNNDVSSEEQMPSAFSTYHGINYYFYDCSVVSIEENDANANINLYPNPAAEKLILSFNTEKDRIATIFSSSGTLVGRYNISGSEYSISLSSLINGMYFITIMDGESTSVKKFIKE